jgi:mannose-1-phosphate guanylyltransferase
VILSGGSGTRLWPASRRKRPKQLLPLGKTGETLLEAAIRRARALTEHIWIVTAESQAEDTRAVAPGCEIIAEPSGRNTAAAIGLAAAVIATRDPAATLAVLPADQYVADASALVACLRAVLAAVERVDAIGTVGITPTRVETGFGYLELAPGSAEAGTDATAAGFPTTAAVREVTRFVEKPDRATAERYVASGRYLWNAGMFALTAKRALAELDRHLPETARAVRAIAAGGDARALYEPLPSISIDHAVMEKTDRVVAVAAEVGWDDVGSWASVANHASSGPVVVLDGDGNIAISDDGTLIATVGVSDLVVVKSGDAILVIPKDRAQDVRKVIEALSARGLARYL